jgi:hypothetical protein
MTLLEKYCKCARERSEGKDCRIFPRPKRIDQGLTHKQADSNANGDSYHGSTNINTTTVGSYPPRLRQTGLGKK